MSGLATRRVEEEAYPDAPPDETLRTFSDMRRINRLFGPHRILRSFLRRADLPAGAPQILDIGAGAGDALEVVKAHYPRASLTALDLRPAHLVPLPYAGIAANALHLPFAPECFDLVLINTMLHEFPEPDARLVLQQAWRVTRRCLFVLDLERRWVAHRFLHWTQPVFRWQKLTLRDGPISVAAGFRTRELRRLAESAGVPVARIASHPPWFRVTLEAWR